MLKRYGIGICCYILLFFLPLYAQPQLQVEKNNYPTWQVVNDTRETCYPSAAYVSFSNLTRGEKYLYRAFFSRSSSGDFGEVYNAEVGEFVDHSDIGNLPVFTATSGDTAFLVVYRTVPDMLGHLGHWDLNFQAREVNAGGFEGGKTVPDTVGSAMAGSNEFPMGYLQFSGDVLSRPSQSAGRGLRKAVAVDGSPVRGMYITEPNGIPEGFPNIDGYYFLAYPAASYDTLRVGMRSLDNDPLGFDYLTDVRITLGDVFDISGPQVFGYIGPNDYSRWQYVHDSDPDACYPSAARITLTGLRTGKEYALSARFYRLLEGGFGFIYDPQSESFVKWDDTSNLPRFTATRNDTSLWVIYRTDPQMAALDNPFGIWLFSVNAAEVGSGAGFSADLALPVRVGNESSELFPMGFIEAPRSQLQPAAPVENRIMAIRHSTSGYNGMYITEDNGIAEKFPSEVPGFYYIPYPSGQYRELFFQTRSRSDNSALGQTSQKNVTLPAGGTLQGDPTLPVSLVSFQAISLNHKVQLNWSTASETNNLGFEIWRSLSPAGEFRIIADYNSDPGLQGSGNSNVQRDYQFTDEALQNGVTYFYQLSDVSIDGQRTFHHVVSATPGEVTPAAFTLSQNYPNPFNPETTIEYTIGGGLRQPLPVSLRIYNSLGQAVRVLEEGRQYAGSYRVVWNGRDDGGRPLPSGVYYCVLKAERMERAVKMLLLR